MKTPKFQFKSLGDTAMIRTCHHCGCTYGPQDPYPMESKVCPICWINLQITGRCHRCNNEIRKKSRCFKDSHLPSFKERRLATCEELSKKVVIHETEGALISALQGHLRRSLLVNGPMEFQIEKCIYTGQIDPDPNFVLEGEISECLDLGTWLR